MEMANFAATHAKFHCCYISYLAPFPSNTYYSSKSTTYDEICLIAPSLAFAIVICNSDKQLCIAMKGFNSFPLWV